MPIYEFRCSCGNDFEKICRSGESDNAVCPVCGSVAAKVFSTFSVGRSAPAAGCGFNGPPPGGCSGCSFGGHHH